MLTRVLRAVLPALVTLPLILGAGVAEAHGREVKIAISSLAPDSNNARTRLYRAYVTYEDGDPAPGLQVALSAVRRQDGMTLGPVPFAALSQPGAYVAEATYPSFGTWSVTLRVRGEGEGETTFSEEVLPAAPTATLSGKRTPPDIRQAEVFFRFGASDGAHIAVRVLHTLSAMAWFGLTAFVVAVHWFAPVGVQGVLLQRVARVFPAGTLASLGLLLASGVYNAVYNAPNRFPGLFAPATLARFPFGDAYLVTFYLKVLLFLVSVAITLVLAVGFLHLNRGKERSEGPMHRWALSGAVLGILIFMDVSVLVYFHYLSHLGALLP